MIHLSFLTLENVSFCQRCSVQVNLTRLRFSVAFIACSGNHGIADAADPVALYPLERGHHAKTRARNAKDEGNKCPVWYTQFVLSSNFFISSSSEIQLRTGGSLQFSCFLPREKRRSNTQLLREMCGRLCGQHSGSRPVCAHSIHMKR